MNADWAHNRAGIAHTMGMAKKNSKKMIEHIYDGSVCATECTGLLQKIAVDNEDVAKYHEEYTKDKK